jgi:hypothetical protein
MAASAVNVSTNLNTPIGVYVSSDYGVTWTSTFSGFAWDVAVSSTGQYMATCINDGWATPNSGGKIYVSTNYGVSWTACSGSPTNYWFGVAISDNGSYITGTNYSNNICYSSNGGTTFGTFTCAGSAGNTYKPSISSTGQYQMVGSTSGTNGIYLSINYGATWSTVLTVASTNFYTTSMSSTGQYQAACNGDLYLSTNYGASGSWVKMAGAFASGSNGQITISSTGQYQIISNGSAIYYSNNYGADGSWILIDANIATNVYYSSINISKNGQYISVGNVNGGQTINVYNTLPNAPTNLSVQSTTSSSATITFTPTAGVVTSYLATAMPGSLTGTSTGSPITISGLSVGTAYTVTIQAITSFGTSVASSSVSATPTILAILYYNFESGDVQGTTLKNYANGLYDLTLSTAAAISTSDAAVGTSSLKILTNATQYATYNTNIVLPTATTGNGYSVSFWIKVLSGASGGSGGLNSFMGWVSTIETTLSSLATNFHIQISNSDVSIISSFFSANGSIATASYLPNWTNPSGTNYDNAWHHFCFVFQYTSSTAGNATLYRDNVAISTLSMNSNVSQFTIKMIEIGHRTDGRDNWFGGYIDQFLFYKIPLTTAQITQLYNKQVV